MDTNEKGCTDVIYLLQIPIQRPKFRVSTDVIARLFPKLEIYKTAFSPHWDTLYKTIICTRDCCAAKVNSPLLTNEYNYDTVNVIITLMKKLDLKWI